MKIDALDLLALGGLVLIGVGLWLTGYPMAIAAVGVVVVVMGVLPHTKGRK